MQLEIRQLHLAYAHQRIRTSAKQRALAASLLQHGQQVPVLVVEKDGVYVLIDGYARVDALVELARDIVDVVVLEVPEVDGLVLRHRLAASKASALEEGWLLVDLIDRHGIGQQEAALRLQRSKSWVSRRLALVKVLPDSVQDAVKKGIVPAHAAMKFLVVMARANARQCSRLVEQLGSEPVTVRQIERLYMAWRQGADTLRERIANNPRLYLMVDDEVTEPAVVDEAERLGDDLEAISGCCRRANRRVRNGVLQTSGPEVLKQVATAWQGARLAFESLSSRMEGRGGDRLRHPDSDPGAASTGARKPPNRTGAEDLEEHSQVGTA